MLGARASRNSAVNASSAASFSFVPGGVSQAWRVVVPGMAAPQLRQDASAGLSFVPQKGQCVHSAKASPPNAAIAAVRRQLPEPGKSVWISGGRSNTERSNSMSSMVAIVSIRSRPIGSF